MADVVTRTLSNYLATLQATPSEDVTLVTQNLETWSTANLVTPGDLGTAAYQDTSYFALAAAGALAETAVQSVSGSGAISVNNTDPKNPIISFSGVGLGDVSGPASSVNDRIATFNGTTGKVIKDSGLTSASFASAAQGTKADTALQPAAIGTTVQGYSAVLAGTTASFTTADETKLDGIASGATANNTDAFLLSRANHTGTQSADTLTDGTTNKAFLTTERTKLAGIAAGATANATDAQLRDRATHTGTQAATTITGLATVATTGAYNDLTGKPTLGTLAGKSQIDVPTDINAGGTPSATTYLRGDGNWATPAGGGGGGGTVNSIVAGTGIAVNSLDAANPIVSWSSDAMAAFANVENKLLDKVEYSDIGVSVQAYSAVLQATTASFTTADETKLDGIAAGATANSSDAFLLARANHTGTQAASTITGLATVSTTGAYADLSGKPTLGTAAATNSTDYATAAQGAKADSALQPAAIGVSVQAYDADLATWAGVTRASGFDTFASTPSSANFAALVTDKTGTGSNVFATSPTLVTPNLGTPSAVNLTNGTALPIATGVSGLATGVATFLATPTSANLRAAVTDESGTGALLFAGGALGTPASGTLTNATGLPIVNGTTGTLTVARGGTGLTAITAGTVMVGTGTTAPTLVAAGTSGNVLTSNGTTWTSAAPASAPPGLVLISTQTPSVVAAVDFTGISTTYDEYEIHLINVIPSTSAAAILQFSSDGGTSFIVTGYTSQGQYMSGSTITGISGSSSSIDLSAGQSVNNSATTGGINSTVTIRRPAEPIGTFVSYNGMARISTTYSPLIGSGSYAAATAINAFRILFAAGNITSGIIRLYGIRK